MTENKFVECVTKLGIEINDLQLNQLKQYYELLIEYNNKINLTAIVNKEDVYLKHFYDSLTLFKAIDLNKIETMCDVGSGAGFPGIVIKILFPKIKITLIDSLNKRILFLKDVIKKLNLKEIEAIHQRAEIFALSNREKYDLVTARAVAPLNVLSELCIPLIKKDGYFVAMKGNNKEELKTSEKAIKKLGGNITKIINFILIFENSNRTLIKIKKVNLTSKKFPRKYSDIKKNPL